MPNTLGSAADGRPFFCGRYFPKRNFVELLATVAQTWRTRPRVAGFDAAYVCRGSVCDLPVTIVADLAAALGRSV